MQFQKFFYVITRKIESRLSAAGKRVWVPLPIMAGAVQANTLAQPLPSYIEDICNPEKLSVLPVTGLIIDK